MSRKQESEALAAAVQTANQQLAPAIQRARGAGITWEEIGTATEITPYAAFQRWATDTERANLDNAAIAIIGETADQLAAEGILPSALLENSVRHIG